MSEKKKLLFIINDVNFFISHRLIIAKAAIQNNYNVYLFSGKANLKNLNILRKNKINYKYIPISRSSKNFLIEIYLFLLIFFNILRLNPFITHLVTVKPILYGGIICKILNKRVIFAITGLNYINYIFGGYKNNLNRIFSFIFIKLYNFIFKNKNSKIILQNLDDYEYFKKNYKIKLDNIYIIKGSGVNLKKFKYSNPPNTLPLIIFPSRMLIDKGFYEFINAAKIVNKNKILAEFILAGSHDPHNPKSISMATLNSFNGVNGIKWVGYVENIENLFEKSSIVVLPSYQEGLPKSLQDAAAIGRAIITTNTNGCREVVDNNINGYLVPIYDYKLIADKINFLLKNKNILIEMGRKSRLKAEKEFDETLIVDKHLNIYKKFRNDKKTKYSYNWIRRIFGQRNK